MCGLPLGVTWKKENTIELNATNTKEDCSSPEAGLSEDAENTTSSLSFRGVSIDDFLEVDKTEGKESSGSNVMFENEVSDQE